MNTNLWTHPKWKLGGVSNPDPAIRRDALAVALQCVDIAQEVGCMSVALWPGSDGWDYNFEANYGKLLDRFIQACIEINRKAMSKGLRFGIEAKLHEPREGNIVICTTHKATLVAREVNEVCGGRNMGVAIDYGHEQMYGNEPADAVYTALRFGVPVVNFHVNTAKLHSNDEDRVTGTGDIWRLTDFCYAAIDTGYPGWFGEDQFTYRMEQVKAMALSKELFANAMKKALRIYAIRDQLEAAQATGDAGRTIDVVKEIIL
jgi:xylose isomerase